MRESNCRRGKRVIDVSQATDLREFAYSEKYWYVEQDWDICVVDFDHRSLYLEFALYDDCWQQDLFLHKQYVLVGSLVYDGIADRLTLNDDCEVVCVDPIKGPREPHPADVRTRIATILDELKDVQDENFGKLSEAIRTKIAEPGSGFDYNFWFQGGWKVDDVGR